MCAAVLIFWDPLAIEFKVSRRDIAGIWLLPLLHSPKGASNIVAEQGEVGDAPKSAIRVGDYKLVRNATAQHTAPGREHHRVMETSTLEAASAGCFGCRSSGLRVARRPRFLPTP